MRLIILLALWITSLTLMSAQSERTFVREGNREYKDNKFTDAEVNYRKALERNKELHEGTFNLGDALYKQGRFDEAAEQYRLSTAKNGDGSVQAQAYHNLGNALLKGQKYPESIAAYKNALKLNSNDADTKYNLEYAKAMLKQQQQKQQQQQNKDQKKDDKQKQDKQKNDQQKQDRSKQDQQKQDQQKQDSEKQQSQDQKQNQQKQGQQKKQQISKEDAERILEALKNEEKGVQKKLHKKVPARIKVEKDW